MRQKKRLTFTALMISVALLLGACGGTGFVKTEKKEQTPEEIKAKYLEYLKPADDEFDYLFANDYIYNDLVQTYSALDSKAYHVITGIEKQITIEDIEEVLEKNDNIEDKYKTFILDYVRDWLSLYPNSDFSVLYYNLQTLSIDTVTSEAMMKETLSTDSAACYLKDQNRILLLEDQDFSKGTDNYIILTHELTHCARGTWIQENGTTKKKIGFYEYHLMGTYAEEGIITNIAYELQGDGQKAVFYPFQSSCYRIIMDCVDYTPEDFMNHSVYYLMKKMDDFMGDEQYAYHIVVLIDSQASLRYTSYQSVDYEEFGELYDYLTRMYMKKYLSEDMTMVQAEEVYQEFLADIMFNFENMNRKYEIYESDFRPSFEKCVEELGIQ